MSDNGETPATWQVTLRTNMNLIRGEGDEPVSAIDNADGTTTYVYEKCVPDEEE